MQAPIQSLPSEQAAFAKHLFTQGYPLWSPDPVLLPDARQSTGLKIGDVGIVDERGRFDVFFNILEPPLPVGISNSLQLNSPLGVEYHARRLDEDILPREVVSSPETPWDVDRLEVLTVGDISRRTTQYSATLSNDGAHIILPQGAQSFELRSQHRNLFENYAREHGAKWLEVFKDQLGWSRSNSLYLLTGFYKTCSWSIASFGMQTAANTNPVYVNCTLVEVDERTIREESIWHPAGRFKRKIGPAPDRQGQNNQTVFIRGITITPNDVSGEGQNAERHATGTLFGALSTRIPFLNTMMGSTEVTETQTPESNVIIQYVPPISQASHPSEVINRYLLRKEPSAKIAVTHDSQWISMLEMLGKGRSWKLEDLESHLDVLVSEHAIARHNSTVYLRDKEDPITHFALERSATLSSDMPVEWEQYAVAQHSGSLDGYGPSFGRDDDIVGTLLQKRDSEPGVDDMRLMPLRHVDLADDSNLATTQRVVPRYDRAWRVHSTAAGSHRGSRSNTDISGRGPLIPQEQYTISSIPSYNSPHQQPPITFDLENPVEIGIPITDILNNTDNFARIRDRTQAFSNIGKKTFTLRIQWPGYKPWSKTLAAMDWTKSRDPITRVKLAQAVANGVRDLIVKYRDEPYDPDYAEWNVGPKGIQLDQICLVALHNVSRGSWQPQLCLLEPRS